MRDSTMGQDRRIARRSVVAAILLLLAATLWWQQVIRTPEVFAKEQKVSAQKADAPGAASPESPEISPAALLIYNRPIAILRGKVFGYPPQERINYITEKLASIVKGKKTFAITTKKTTEGTWILLDGDFLLMLTPGDVDQSAGQTLEELVTFAVDNLREVFGEMQRMRDPKYILRSVGIDLGLLVLLVFAGMLALRLEHGLSHVFARIEAKLDAHAQVIGVNIGNNVVKLLGWLTKVLNRVGIVAVLYMWLTFVFRQFLYTRAWGEQSRAFFLGLIAQFGRGLVRILPDLFVVAIIFAAARGITGLVRYLFNNMQRQGVGMLKPEKALPTSRIIIGLIWVFAVMMMYPYLPGSDSDAFKSVGVFVGLLLTLGGSAMVGQVLGGFLLMYSQEVETGDYVNVEGVEGTVASIGFFFTKVRTLKNEAMIFPNSVLIGKTICNYSRQSADKGLIVYTSVTIGYNAPWRQVHAMLREAADKTPGLRAEPQPFIMQRALTDFYVEYELNAYIEEPRDRRPVLSALHANSQDLFNTHGVQIMSPHYEGDPAEKVWVPKDKWFVPPADKSNKKAG